MYHYTYIVAWLLKNCTHTEVTEQAEPFLEVIRKTILFYFDAPHSPAQNFYHPASTKSSLQCEVCSAAMVHHLSCAPPF